MDKLLKYKNTLHVICMWDLKCLLFVENILSNSIKLNKKFFFEQFR